MTEERPPARIAEPAPLGSGAFALTTLALSAHNAGWAPGSCGSGSPCSTVGWRGSWRGRGSSGRQHEVLEGFGWFLLGSSSAPSSSSAFAVFDTHMMLWSPRVSVAMFMVFLTLAVGRPLWPEPRARMAPAPSLAKAA